MLKIAIPNKGSLSEAAVEILAEAGYAGRGESKTLNVYDKTNDVEFFFLRPKDIAIYVAGGQLDLGITGRDLATDSHANVEEVMSLGFGKSSFRYAAPADQKWTVEMLEGKRIATSYPNLVRDDLQARGINATVIRLDGAVEISIKLGVAWLGTTLINHYIEGIKGFSGDILERSPWMLAVVLFAAAALLYSQAATAKALIPAALAIGVSPLTVIASFAAVSALFVLPTYPTLLAAVEMDDTGSTRIGKAVFNHPFLIPGTVGIAISVALGFLFGGLIL
ncbi:ATP phosphoribosyltransferase [Corynebacterium diphtheriae]